MKGVDPMGDHETHFSVGVVGGSAFFSVFLQICRQRPPTSPTATSASLTHRLSPKPSKGA